MYSTSDAPAPDSVYANFKTIRRNGSVVAFEPGKISVAMSKAFWPWPATRAPRRRASATRWRT